MSIVRLAVENHLRINRQTIRQLLAAAFYKKYQKPIPTNTLDEDERRWNAGENNILYLYEMMSPQSAY